MFFASADQFGHAAFLRAYNSLPILSQDRIAALSRWLDVSERTVNDWISGRRDPPRAVCYATWLESMDGRAHVNVDLLNDARRAAGHARSLGDALSVAESTIAALRAELDALKAERAPKVPAAANDGRFDVDRPPVRPAA